MDGPQQGGRLSANQAAPARTWIWSDLHLDHADVVWCFDRPFRSVEGMRRALFEAWRQTVDETDVIICLGDVTVGPANPPIDEALAALPGETILVAGNHDVAGGGKDYGFEAAYGVCAGFDAQGRDIGQLRERMAHLEGPPRADVRTPLTGVLMLGSSLASSSRAVAAARAAGGLTGLS